MAIVLNGSFQPKGRPCTVSIFSGKNSYGEGTKYTFEENLNVIEPLGSFYSFNEFDTPLVLYTNDFDLYRELFPYDVPDVLVEPYITVYSSTPDYTPAISYRIDIQGQPPVYIGPVLPWYYTMAKFSRFGPGHYFLVPRNGTTSSTFVSIQPVLDLFRAPESSALRAALPMIAFGG